MIDWQIGYLWPGGSKACYFWNLTKNSCMMAFKEKSGMDPKKLGEKYDKIAVWWHQQHVDSQYGVQQISRALKFCRAGGEALDVGCGAGGRFIRLMNEKGLAVTGLDVSAEMIRLARQHHPDAVFHQADICDWQTSQTFDFIFAWDSIFHLPLNQQKPVITRLCQLLAPGGVLAYTFGDAVGEHTDRWHDDTFHYSSIGISANLAVIAEQGLTCRHLELDQWPQKHVFIIVCRD